MRKTPKSVNLAPLEAALGYEFKDKSLLVEALTTPSYRNDHPSLASTNDNQRLEFLGDAVFGLLSAQQLFNQFTEVKEGSLTKMRSHLASGAALGELARRVGVGKYLRLGAGQNHQNGRDNLNFLADAMEAIFGAAWCDGSLSAAEQIYRHLQIGVEVDSIQRAIVEENPKGALQEIAQSNGWRGFPVYELVSSSGPSHAPLFEVRAVLPDGISAVASAGSKHAAETEAARQLLEKLSKKP